MDKDNPNNPKSRLPRREFLANLLFAGGILSVTALQSEYGVVASAGPKDEGWELPEDKRKDPPADGWELPDDLLDSPKPPSPKPPVPPEIMGRRRPPELKGEVKPPPPRQGSVVAPWPKKRSD
jgi:hypothetical protein